MQNYSVTYLAQIAQFISFALAMASIQVDPSSLETTMSVVITVVSGCVVLYRRWSAGGVTLLGARSK